MPVVFVNRTPFNGFGNIATSIGSSTSHNDSYAELFQRNVDDGIANREIAGLRLEAGGVVPTIFAQVRDDWRYLERECRFEADELEHWRVVSVLRRTAQVMGQWIGTNHDQVPDGLATSLSLVDRTRAGAKDSDAGIWAI